MKYNQEQIKEILPHRSPMLLVSSVEEVVPGESITSAFRVEPELEIFKGHFPENPVLPGVYTAEFMAQTADILFMLCPEYAGKTPLLLGLNNFRFLKPVRPGDTIICKGKFLSERKDKAIVSAALEAFVGGAINSVVLSGEALTGGALAASGEITLAMR